MANFDPMTMIWTIFGEVHLRMLYTKYLSSKPCSFGEDFFKLIFLKSIFSYHDLDIQQMGTILTNLIKLCARIISIKFHKIWLSGFRGDVVWMNCGRLTTVDGWRTFKDHISLVCHYDKGELKNRPSYPIFFGHVTGTRHIFLFIINIS